MAMLQTTRYTPNSTPNSCKKRRKEKRKTPAARGRVVNSSQNGNAHVRREAPILVVTYLPPRLLFFSFPPPTPRLLYTPSLPNLHYSRLFTPFHSVSSPNSSPYLSLSSPSIRYWVGSDTTGPVGFRTPQSSPVNSTSELPTTLSLLTTTTHLS